MKQTIIFIFLATLTLSSFSQSGKQLKFNEAYRPQYHFSPEINRMGAPVAVFQVDSTYHLFYQLNPHNLQEGFVNLGHAHSKDLLRWVHDSVFIAQPENVSDSMLLTPWWGSITANSDGAMMWYNSWGEGINKIKIDKEINILTKEKVAGLEEFNKSEPFVFEDDKSDKLYMLNYNRADSTMNLFESTEGINWQKHISFNFKYGFPCFIEIPLTNKPDDKKWLLLTEKGIYAICDFKDNKIEFTSPLSRFDEGKKTGGSICFHDKIKDRYIVLSELKSDQHPDLPSNGQLSFPKEINLQDNGSGIEIIRKPIDEIKSLYNKNYTWKDVKIYPGINNNILSRVKETSFHLKGIIDLKNCDQFGFFIRSDKDRNGTEINYSVVHEQLSVLNCKINYKPVNKKVDIEILVDRSSIEIFVDGGKYSISSSFIPDMDKQRCELYTIGGEVIVDYLEINSLKSIWREE